MHVQMLIPRPTQLLGVMMLLAEALYDSGLVILIESANKPVSLV